MHQSRPPDLPALFALLAASPLRFVVSGSVAAQLHGVEVPDPGDLDIVPAMDRENLVALRNLILELEGHPVSLGHWITLDTGERKWIEDTREPATLEAWKPDPDDPASFDNLLHTRLGNFDPVPELTGTYEELAATSVTRDAHGHQVRVASVEMLLSRLTVPRREKDIARVRALREVQRRRASERTWITVLRPCRPADLPVLAEIFRQAALRVGSTAYTGEQADAWSRYPDDREAFTRRLSGGVTLVAEVEGQVVSFGQLDPEDHVAFLYTAPDWTRRGLGTAIHRELERAAREAGVTLLRVEASRIARPLFEKLGYDVVEVEISPWKGLGFERFRMQKRLWADASDPA